MMERSRIITEQEYQEWKRYADALNEILESCSIERSETWSVLKIKEIVENALFPENKKQRKE